MSVHGSGRPVTCTLVVKKMPDARKSTFYVRYESILTKFALEVDNGEVKARRWNESINTIEHFMYKSIVTRVLEGLPKYPVAG